MNACAQHHHRERLLGHCARCGVLVFERNFGTASRGKILLVWCSQCHAANQQSTLELAEASGH